MRRFILIILFSIILVPTSFAQDYTYAHRQGLHAGFSLGTWFPDRSQNVLRTPLFFGVMADYRRYSNVFGLTFDMIFGFKTEEFKINYADSVFTNNSFSGANFTFDYSREFWSKNRLIFDGTCGIGYGFLSYGVDNESHEDIGKSSIILNPGLSIRCLIRKNSFLQLKVQYSISNYDLKDNNNSDLRGNFFIIKLIYGSNYHKLN